MPSIKSPEQILLDTHVIIQAERERTIDALNALAIKIETLTIEVRTDAAARQVMCASAAHQRHEHHEVLFGNNGLGLKSRVQSIEQGIAWTKTALAAVFLPLIGLVIDAVWRHLRK